MHAELHGYDEWGLPEYDEWVQLDPIKQQLVENLPPVAKTKETSIFETMQPA